MRKLFIFALVLMLSLPLVVRAVVNHASAVVAYSQEQSGQVLPAPQNGRRVRRRADRRRRHRRTIKGEFGEAGRSAGRGGKRLGQNVAHGRLARGGKEFGKGMGGFGKHTGKGIGRSIKRAVTP